MTHASNARRAAHPSRLRRCARQLVGIGALVAAAIAAHVWAALVRCQGACGVDLRSQVLWSSAWLWAGLMSLTWLAYGGGRALIARVEQKELATRLRRDGAR